MLLFLLIDLYNWFKSFEFFIVSKELWLLLSVFIVGKFWYFFIIYIFFLSIFVIMLIIIIKSLLWICFVLIDWNDL